MVSITNKYISLAVIGSFIFGYELAILNLILPRFQSAFEFNNKNAPFDKQTITQYLAMARSAVFVGAATGASAAWRIGGFGRRGILLSCFSISILGGLIMICSYSFPFFITGRLLAGLSVGLATVGSPAFISEMCQIKEKGTKGLFHQVFICTGILVALSYGFILPETPELVKSSINLTIPRVLVSIPAILSIIGIILMSTVLKHDTPLSYIEQGKSKLAINVLNAIYKNNLTMAEEQYDELSESIIEKNSNTKTSTTIAYIFSNSYYRYALLVGCLLSIAQQIGGINCFVTMSTDLFISTGLSVSAAKISSFIMALANLVMIIPSIFLIERVGRKPLLIFGTLGQTLCLSIVPIMKLFSLDVAMSSVIAVVGYIIFFSVAQGPVVWVYIFEMFPTEMKGMGTSIASTLNWIAAMTMVYFNSVYDDKDARFGKFHIFTMLCGATLIFLIICLKETKGATRSPYSPPFHKDETIPLHYTNSGEKVV